MNNEIKEILDIEKYRNKDGYVENISLLPSEIHKILDYITNLQEENKNRISESLSYDLANAKVKELENKIDKALEYIDNTDIIRYSETSFRIDDMRFFENIRKILRGDNNE